MSNTIVTISESIIFEQLGERVVLLDLNSEQYFELNGVGSRMWCLVQEHSDLDEVVKLMAEEYDSDEPTLRAELVEFVSRLEHQGWLQTNHAPTG